VNAHTRRAVAYIAGRRAGGRQSSAVYDYAAARYFSMSGDVSGDNASIYDYEQSCYVTGAGDSLYHYGNSAHLMLQISGSRFSGYDYASSSHFSGTLTGNAISLYDYETNAYYNYAI
jgi:hypothetical protein